MALHFEDCLEVSTMHMSKKVAVGADSEAERRCASVLHNHPRLHTEDRVSQSAEASDGMINAFAEKACASVEGAGTLWPSGDHRIGMFTSGRRRELGGPFKTS